ncbi:MAG: HAD-IC family P-type ATPase, partial [Actinomycetia bacterium]|nr:HAD-IC family P-type ATPase [Actinomycetes bacterium]
SPGTGRDELVTVAAAAGAGSSHPLSRAIAALAPTVPAAAQATAVPGRGIRAAVAGHAVVLGRPDWVGAEVASHETASAPPAEGAGTAVAVGWDGAVRGTFEVHDAVRPDAAAAVAAFRHLGLAPVLLTGDAPGPARTVAAQTGIEDVRAALAPADKVAAIAALQAAGRRVAMVGDGINDAAALAQADLGIAMGGGTDAAIAAADLTLMRADLTLAVDAVRLARVCFRTIRTNFFWALAYNVVAIPVAAAGWLNPMIAGAAMACSSLFVVGNSLRLRWFRPAQA